MITNLARAIRIQINGFGKLDEITGRRLNLWRLDMGGEASEQVMELLKELALLKALDKHYEANPNQAEAEFEEHRIRQQRHDEITAAIKDLAETKKAEA